MSLVERESAALSLHRSLRLALLLSSVAGVLAACGGGGGGGNGGGGGGGGGTPVTISGKITFDRVPFKATLDTGLDFANVVESPAREVVVQAVEGTTVLTSTTTDASGNYSMSVATGHTIVVRARAQMQKTGAAPTWNFTVRNNTNTDALYALDSASFATSVDAVKNLRATSGFAGGAYTGERQAAPFAILDTIYKAKQTILGAKADAAFPDLSLFWSTSNKDVTDNQGNHPFCPTNGSIVTTAYLQADVTNDCTPAGTSSAGIYILGDFVNGKDTDEFDEHVMAHEFGHYFEDKFARSDSIGGTHGGAEKLELRLAFSEGWGDGFSGIATNDPIYRDSFNGAAQDFGFNLENEPVTTPGYYSELGIAELFWDVFDNQNDGGDTLSLGFTPIFNAWVNGVKNTDALTSIYTFLARLKADNAGSSAAIDTLANAFGIHGTGDFGAGETNFGGDASFPAQPAAGFYPALAPNATVGVCTTAALDPNGDGNKVGEYKYFTVTLAAAASITVNVAAAIAAGEPGNAIPAGDPDVFLWSRGVSKLTGGRGTGTTDSGTAANLAAGTYILEVVDFDYAGGGVTGNTPHCLTVSYLLN